MARIVSNSRPVNQSLDDKGAATLSKDLPSAATPKSASTMPAKSISAAPKR